MSDLNYSFSFTFFNEEDWLGRADFLERRCEILASLYVCDGENKPWIRKFLSFKGICLLLFTVPEPFVKLLLCESSLLDELTEVFLVPGSVVKMVVANENFHLLLSLATLILV